MLNLYEELTAELKPFYKASKQHYLTYPAKYNYFTTLAQHICKAIKNMYVPKSHLFAFSALILNLSEIHP